MKQCNKTYFKSKTFDNVEFIKKYYSIAGMLFNTKEGLVSLLFFCLYKNYAYICTEH